MKSKIHRCNCSNTWTVQNRKCSIRANTMLLNGKWYVELKPKRKSNPKGFVVTDRSEDIIISPPKHLFENFNKIKKLVYDKENVFFNVQQGEYLYFAEDGACYILQIKR
ncbi:hypothetical protein [Niallia endozanthoxylica]|uniref:Uncharacterized protein n=1 Tax=Niallia endozanthoxylica TaxID=2036016 RepID=A0A5J5H2V6_9BACI|nr:hypothetical protein [Niallia endozanthoxylica]KAA9014567.1 hypothetical protein F4V44_23780 [Niallia endozanthoxylica]